MFCSRLHPLTDYVELFHNHPNISARSSGISFRTYKENYVRSYSFYRSLEFPELIIGNQITNGSVDVTVFKHDVLNNKTRYTKTIFESWKVILGAFQGQLKITRYKDSELKSGESLRELFIRKKHIGTVNLNGNEFYFVGGTSVYRRSY